MKSIEKDSIRARLTEHRTDGLNKALRFGLLAILTAGICFSLPNRAEAGPGDLDTSFGTNGTGKVIAIPAARGGSVVIQHNGKIVVTASTGNNVATRLNRNGTVDTTFASQGTLVFYDGSVRFGMILDADDRLLSFGGRPVYGSEGVFHMQRYSPDGVLDTSFGSAGGVDVNMGDFAEAQGAAVQPDGKIVLAGFAQTPTQNPFRLNRHFAVVRCMPDGTLDSTFGTGGRVITGFGGDFETAQGVAFQPDGKIVVAGLSTVRIAVARYTTTGALDSSFNGTGQTTMSFGPDSQSFGAAFTVAVQRDDKIVVGGWVNVQMALARFNADGTVDSSFGTNGTGVVIHREGGWDSWQKILLQPDGKIIAYGHSSTTPWLVVTRYLPNGLPDPSFGMPPTASRIGTELIAIGGGINEATGLALQPNGKLLLAASAYQTNNQYSDAAVARLENDGVAFPAITCPQPIFANCGESATLTVSVSDPSGLPLTAVWNVNGDPVQTNSLPGADTGTNFVIALEHAYVVGTNEVSLTVTDSLNNGTSCSTLVTVIDQAPVISSASADPSLLWPPNHKLVPVNVTATVTDNCDESATWKIVQVSSNQQFNKGEPDWIITGASSVLLRAERSDGTDRVYTITIQATSSSGNISDPKNVRVIVLQGSGTRK